MKNDKKNSGGGWFSSASQSVKSGFSWASSLDWDSWYSSATKKIKSGFNWVGSLNWSGFFSVLGRGTKSAFNWVGSLNWSGFFSVLGRGTKAIGYGLAVCFRTVFPAKKPLTTTEKAINMLRFFLNGLAAISAIFGKFVVSLAFGSTLSILCTLGMVLALLIFNFILPFLEKNSSGKRLKFRLAAAGFALIIFSVIGFGTILHEKAQPPKSYTQQFFDTIKRKK